MRVLYLDCPTGLSGDMCMAALIDAGLDVNKLKRELKKLPVKDYAIITSRERRHAINGTRFKVRIQESHHHRTFKDIKSLIEKSRLPKPVKNLSIKIFRNLAVAEGKVHGISPLKVHFHEVGAVDSIVDIVGAAIALIELKIDRVYASPIPVGSGSVKTMHGVLPIPAPATVELLKGIPIASSPIPMELTTPTGAAILKTVAVEFGPIPPMTIETIGYGVGGKDFRELANAARAIIGTAEKAKNTESAYVIETNIDDMNPQLTPYLIEKLLEAGAIEAYSMPVTMKKCRQGSLVTALTKKEKLDAVVQMMLKESTSIGVRFFPAERKCLERKIVKIKTAYGQIKVKLSYLGGRMVNAHPEFEDAKKTAKKRNIPLKLVMEAAKAAAFKNSKFI